MAHGVWLNGHIMLDAQHSIEQAALVVEQGKVAWVGAQVDLPKHYLDLPQHDMQNAWMTPGLIDCHTHLVYAGLRADEFAMRLAGADYQAIAQAGGGILSTVRATRLASEDTLFALASERLEALLSEGVCALEIKSGYGLDLASERKQLRVARRLSNAYDVPIYTTFLGAHALPPEYQGRADAYIDLICAEMLPTLAAEGLVDAVDAFCEGIGFSVAQTDKVFNCAQRLGLPVKLHAEQLSLLGGTQLVARYQGLSADHIEYLDESGVQAMAQAGTVAVLLPGAYYFLRETQLPPIALLRQYQVPIAISTDHNPGTSPTTSLLLMMNMAATCFKLTVPEILAGVTEHAAQALGVSQHHGVLKQGRSADFVLWKVRSLAELVYWMGRKDLVQQVVRKGVIFG